MKYLSDQLYYTALSPVLASALSRGDGGLGLFLAGIGILSFILVSLIFMISLRRKNRFNLFYGFLSVVFSGGAMLLCLLATSVGTLVASPSGDPQETVSGFFDALCAADYNSAYSYLSGYTDLGLGNTPADPVGQTMYAALQESFSYELYGACVEDQLSAHQEVVFTYLDLTAIGPDVEKETMDILSGFVKERPRSELYDSNNNYLPEVAQEAYSAAVRTVLADARDYYTTTSLQLALEYVDGTWLIAPNQNLLSAITGGAA